MSTRWVVRLTLLIFVAYCIWAIGPFVRSVFVRDAALTAWSRTVVAPIAGRLGRELPSVGSLVPDDGMLTTISNPLLLTELQALDRTADRIKSARNEIKESEQFLKELKELDAKRIADLGRISSMFERQLETDVRNLELELSVNNRRLEVLNQSAQRQKDLAGQGVGSKASIEESVLKVAEAELHEAQLKARLAHARLRQEAGRGEIFVTKSGNTPDWLRYGQLELELEIRKVVHQLHRARRLLSIAESDYEKEAKIYNKLKEAKISAPAGAVMVGVSVHTGETVTAGEKLARWIDCNQLLVDVPVSDAELPLIKKGSEAIVVVEGEPSERKGLVLLTRGSAATIGKDQLAATAKGRQNGEAQVLVSLNAKMGDFGEYPIGRAAYVEFPGVGLIDIVRARLRL